MGKCPLWFSGISGPSKIPNISEHEDVVSHLNLCTNFTIIAITQMVSDEFIVAYCHAIHILSLVYVKWKFPCVNEMTDVCGVQMD